MDGFQSKIKKLSPEELESIVKGDSKDKDSKGDLDPEAKKKMDAVVDNAQTAKEVKTDDGKEQILKEVKRALDAGKIMLKVPGKEKGTYDIIISGIKIGT